MIPPLPLRFRNAISISASALFLMSAPDVPAQEIAEPNPPGDQVENESQPVRSKFHLSLSGGWITSGTNDDITNAFNASGFGGLAPGLFGRTEYPVEGVSRFTLNIGASYSVTDRLRLGLVWDNLFQQQASGNDAEVEHARAAFVNLYVDYVIIPVDLQPLSRYELAVGAGVSYNFLTVDGKMSAVAPLVGMDPGAFAVNKNVPGFSVRASLDYYVSGRVSLLAKFEQRFIKPIQVPSVTYQEMSQTKTLVPHSVNFSGMDISLGLHIHL